MKFKLLGTAILTSSLLLTACGESEDHSKKDDEKKSESKSDKKSNDPKKNKDNEKKDNNKDKKQSSEDNQQNEQSNEQNNIQNNSNQNNQQAQQSQQTQQPGTDADMINPNETDYTNQEIDKGAKYQQDQTPYQKEYTDDGHEKYNNNNSNAEVNKEQNNLDSLKENGTISQSEYDEWSKQIRN